MALDSSGNSASRRQQILLGVGAVVLIVAAIVAWNNLRGSAAERVAAERAFICNECGEVFEHVLQQGEMEPLECPKCDKTAAYQAEACYWTKDGKAKLEPTFVLLKKRVDPTTNEKTFCPDCGREVVGHNPKPPRELMEAARAEAGQ